MSDLSDILSDQAVDADLVAANKKGLFQQLAAAAAQLTGLPAKTIAASLNAREKIGSTGFGGGAAIPHGKIEGLASVFGYFARLETPVDFQSIDGLPVDLVFLLLSPPDAGRRPSQGAGAGQPRLPRPADRGQAARRALEGRASSPCSPAGKRGMPPEPRAAGGEAPSRRARPLISARSNRSTARRRSTPCSNPRSRSPSPASPASASRSAPATYPRRRRRAWHALFQDDGRCRLLRLQFDGQRPLPADHRLQPGLHPAAQGRAGDRGGALGERQAPRLRRRGAADPARRRGGGARHRHLHALAHPPVQPRRLSAAA